MPYNPPIGSIYQLYTTYILPIGWLYITYHLLREPETAIEPIYKFGSTPGTGWELPRTSRLTEKKLGFVESRWWFFTDFNQGNHHLSLPFGRMCLDLLLRILCKSKLRSLDEGFVQRRLSIIWGFKEPMQRFFEIPCEGLGVPKQFQMALFGVQKDDFGWEVFRRIYCVLIQNMYPYFTLLAQQPEKDKKKNSTKIPLQTPGKLPCLVDSNHKRSLIAILRLFILGICIGSDTVGGRNPAPVDMVNIPLFTDFTGFHTCLVVQDFFHQQYLRFFLLFSGWMIWHGHLEFSHADFFSLTGSDECAGTHRLLFRGPPVRVAPDVFSLDVLFCFSKKITTHPWSTPQAIPLPNYETIPFTTFW